MLASPRENSIPLPVIGKIIEHFEEKNGQKYLLKSDSEGVSAPIDGQIYFVGQIKDLGLTIIIKNAHTMVTIAHLDKVRVVKNQYVFQGNNVGGVKQNQLVEFNIHPVRSIFSRYVHNFQNHLYKISSDSLSYIHFKNLLENLHFPKNTIPTMYCIAKWESNLNPKALNFNSNNTVDVGLFQINSSWFNKCQVSFSDLYDEKNNAKCALLVYKKQGFNGWTSFLKHQQLCGL